VLDAFPELADLSTPEKARITFRHLLTMSSGLAWDESRPFTDPLNSETGMLSAADPFRYILSQPMQAPPGTLYNYNGGNTSLLAETLVRRTGQPLRDYARDKLFAPLDVAQFDWDGVGRSGKLGAYGSLRLAPRDMAKLGQLLLTDGQWNSRRVLPAGWVAESIKPRLMGQGLFSTAISGGLAAASSGAARSPTAPPPGLAASVSTSFPSSTSSSPSMPATTADRCRRPFRQRSSIASSCRP